MDGKKIIRSPAGESSVYFRSKASASVHAYTLFGRVHGPSQFLWMGLIPISQACGAEIREMDDAV